MCVCVSAFLENTQNLSINSIVPSEMLIYSLITLTARLYFAISVADLVVKLCSVLIWFVMLSQVSDS